jgi:hypothetical protein
MEQLSNNALLQSYLLYQPIRLEICHEKLMSTAKNTGDAILLQTTLFFFFKFNMDVRASLRVPRLISRALKLTTM